MLIKSVWHHWPFSRWVLTGKPKGLYRDWGAGTDVPSSARRTLSFLSWAVRRASSQALRYRYSRRRRASRRSWETADPLRQTFFAAQDRAQETPAPSPRATSPASASPRPPKQELKHPYYHPGRNFHVSPGVLFWRRQHHAVVPSALNREGR